jgi:tyrosine-protein kinase Etk/Wzc
MDASDSQFTLSPVQIVRASLREVLMIAFATTVVFFVYAMLAPKSFQAQIIVVPPATPKGINGVASAASADLPVDLNLGGTDAERIQAVLKSRSVTDAVIEKFHLTDRYGLDFIEATRDHLWQQCSVRVEKRPNTVAVTCEDKDPTFVQMLTESFAEFGNSAFKRVSASAATEERDFLERRVAEAKRDVDEASRKVRDYEEKNHLVDLTEQSKALVSAMASLKGEQLSKEIQLGYLNGFSSSDESTAVQLRKQLAVMSSKMRVLGNGLSSKPKPGSPAETELFPPANSLPNLRYELTELYREQKVQETLFLLLTQRFEIARANAARDTSAFQVLDHAVVPTHKSRPKRAKIAEAGLLFGCTLGIAWAFVRARWYPRRDAHRQSA